MKTSCSILCIVSLIIITCVSFVEAESYPDFLDNGKFPVGDGSSGIASGDLDNDGDLDAAIQNNDSSAGRRNKKDHCGPGHR